MIFGGVGLGWVFFFRFQRFYKTFEVGVYDEGHVVKSFIISEFDSVPRIWIYRSLLFLT